jgi:type IV pilus biogenesis/stability protein PilW
VNRWILALLSLWLVAGCAGTSGGTKKQQNSTVAAAFQEIGARELALGLPEAAIGDLTRALEADDADPNTYHFLGLAYLQLQQYRDAEQVLGIAVERGPEIGEIHNTLGTLYSVQRRWPEAQAAFQRALQCTDYRTPEVALYNIGRVHAEQGDFAAAAVALQQAIAANPGYAPPYLELAHVRDEAGDPEGANQVLQDALTRFPDNGSIFFARGKLLYRQHLYQQALAALSEAHRLVKNESERAEIQRYIDILE